MQQKTKIILGHLTALFVSFVWGITFVSSRIVLNTYSPYELLAIRFTVAYIVLWIIKPQPLKVKNLKSELFYLMAGVTGVFGYFLMENTALLYTSVSNVGLLLAAVPIFVAIVLHIFTDDEKFELKFLYGFMIAISGIAMIIYNGQVNLEVNPFGDFLAIMAGIMWAFYSLALKKVDQDVSPIIQTRRVFFYGSFFSLVGMFIVEGGTDVPGLFVDGIWLHILFLGLLGSGACYVLWSQAMKWIGAVRTTNYIYLMPLFTMLASALVLGETITGLMIIGCLLILAGVYVAENGFSLKGFKGRKSKAYIEAQKNQA